MAPAKPLLALTVAVLAVHALLLRPARQVHSSAPVARTFVARTVAARPAEATPVPVRFAHPVVTEPTDKLVPLAPVATMPRTVAPARALSDHPAAIRTLDATDVAAVAASSASNAAPPASAAQPSKPHNAVAIPGPVRLQYKVQMHKGAFTLDGHGDLRWRHDGQTYEARLELSAPLVRSRTQMSTGRVTAEGLAPLRFSDKHRSEEAAHFDREQGKVSFSSNRPDAPLLPGMQDRLSVLLQLSALMAGAPGKYPPGTSITIQTAGTHDAEPWVFMVEGPEQLQLPGGKVPALKLTRSPRKEYDLKVELWLAPGMDYVPVRLRLTQPNGDSVDQQWSSTDRG